MVVREKSRIHRRRVADRKTFGFLLAGRALFVAFLSHFTTLAMRNAAFLSFCALATSHVAQARRDDPRVEEASDADLLTDINAISRYWGTLMRT